MSVIPYLELRLFVPCSGMSGATQPITTELSRNGIHPHVVCLCSRGAKYPTPINSPKDKAWSFQPFGFLRRWRPYLEASTLASKQCNTCCKKQTLHPSFHLAGPKCRSKSHHSYNNLNGVFIRANFGERSFFNPTAKSANTLLIELTAFPSV